MHAITSIRNQLTGNPQGMTRDELYAKVPADSATDIARAIKSLKDADQIVEISGRFYMKDLSGTVVATSEPIYRPSKKRTYSPQASNHKNEDGIKVHRPYKRAEKTTPDLVMEYMSMRAGMWIMSSEIKKAIGDGTVEASNRINVALATMVTKEKLERHPDQRGLYRVPGVEPEQAPDVKYVGTGTQEPGPTEPTEAPQETGLQIEARFLSHLRELEVDAEKDRAIKIEAAVSTWNDKTRIAYICADARLATIKELIKDYSNFDPRLA